VFYSVLVALFFEIMEGQIPCKLLSFFSCIDLVNG
jgi:hypothetical protein